MSVNSTSLTLVIGMCENPLGDLPCEQLASYLERSLLIWMMLLHLHVTSKMPMMIVVVIVLWFYVPSTAKVIQRRDLGLKSHPKDWRSPGSNSGPLVYKASSLTTTPRRLLPMLINV